MNWLIPFMAIQLSVITPGGYFAQYGDTFIETNIITGIEICNIFVIDNDIKTLADMPVNGNFVPFQIDFKFNAYFSFDAVQLGYSHECFHPISPVSYRSYSGGYDSIFIKYDSRFKNGNK